MYLVLCGRKNGQNEVRESELCVSQSVWGQVKRRQEEGGRGGIAVVLIQIPSVQTRQWQFSGSCQQSGGPTPPRLSMLIPPNVISKMLEKFIALETQPRKPWLLLQDRGNTEGAPLAKRCSSMPVSPPSSPKPYTHTLTLRHMAGSSQSRSHSFLTFLIDK